MTVINNDGESRVTIEELSKMVETMESMNDAQSEAAADLEMLLERLVRKARFKTGERVWDDN